MQVVQEIQNHISQDYVSSVSPKGQITIPIELRKQLGVQKRDKIVLRVEDGEIKLLRPRPSLEAIYTSVPALKTPKTIAEMRSIIQEERAENFL